MSSLTMTPIFDKNSDLVAWVSNNNKHIFDTSMNWIAFISSNNVFSEDSKIWLGPIIDGSILDRNGKVVAWIKDTNPKGTMRPMTPMQPMTPMRPMRPMHPMTPMRPMRKMTPIGGWSEYNFKQWLYQS